MRAVMLIIAILGLAACTHAPDRPPQGAAPAGAEFAAFGPLARLAGTTWRAAGAGEASPADISAWSWDLGGRVLVSRHALADGSYGGVTSTYVNGKTGSLDYVYVTSGGFHTSGTYQLTEDGGWTAEEAVTGHPSITRVRSTGRFLPDGRMSSVSEYFEKGVWVPGRASVYVRTDQAVPEIAGKLAQ